MKMRVDCEWNCRNFASIAMILTVGAAMSLSGCASRVYRPATLPTEYAAAPAVDLESLNLGGLSASGNNADVVHWGDLIEIEVDSGLASLPPRTSKVRVARDGTAKVPLIGCVAVGGMEVERAEAAVFNAARTRDVYPNAFVSMKIVEPRVDRVSVIGAVEEPGTYELQRGAGSLMAAIVSAGGLSDKASGDVEIRHTDARLIAETRRTRPGSNGPMQLVSHESQLSPTDTAVRMNLFDIAATGRASRQLHDGDVVNVVQRELPPVHVLGLVNHPGAYDVTAHRDLRLLDALALAGGCSNGVADKVTVRRLPAGEMQPVTVVASIRKAMDGEENLLLAPGDTIMVRQTPETIVVDVFKSFIRLSLGSSVALF
jgi:polysaccharide export outer membrane protein